MKFLEGAKVIADIIKIGFEIYGLIVDKGRETAEREARIEELERELEELREKSENK